MKEHKLKTDPEHFFDIASGNKKFELRYNDRGYAVGDKLILQETKYSSKEMKDGAPLEYTGHEEVRYVKHIIHGPCYGLKAGYVIMSLTPRAINKYINELRNLGFAVDDSNILDINRVSDKSEYIFKIRKLLSCFNVISFNDSHGKWMKPIELRELLGINHSAHFHRRMNKVRDKLTINEGPTKRVLTFFVNQHIITNILGFKKEYENNKTNIDEYLNTKDAIIEE